MNGELAQTAVLVAYGNGYLHAPERSCIEQQLVARELFPFVRTIQFGEASPLAPVEASLKWFRTLQRKGATRLWLVDGRGQPEGDLSGRLVEGFSNANPRGILVDLPSRQELWMPHWHIGRGHRWLVTYQRLDKRLSQVEKRPQLEDALKMLQKSLRAAQRFASDVKQDFWAELFAFALVALRHPHPVAKPNQPPADDQSNFFPDWGYGETARRLIAGAAIGDVFGGMGSWNDLYFTDRKQQAGYEQVSERLYEAVCMAVTAAANAYCSWEVSNPRPANVLELAKSLRGGADCAFALHDALLEAGLAELAEHFQFREHPPTCWALNALCNSNDCARNGRLRSGSKDRRTGRVRTMK